MKRIFLIALVCFGTASAQAPLDERYLLTCRIWGYIKYFHEKPRNCQIKWDSVLTANLPAIKAASNNMAFNAVLQNFFAAAGTPSMPTTPDPVVAAQDKTNLDLTWFNDPVLDQTIKDQLDTIRRRFRPSATCNVNQAGYGISFAGDQNATVAAALPSTPERLLVAFRYWNYIEYFFNSRNLTDVPWPQAIRRVSMQLDTSTSTLSYHLSMLDLIAGIDDTHSSGAASAVTSGYFGTSFAPLVLKPVEGKPVVTKLLSGAPSQMQVGDVVTHVNGMDVDTFFKKRSRFIAASNPTSLLRDQMTGNKGLLRGVNNSSTTLAMSGPNGTYTTMIVHTLPLNSYLNQVAYTGPTYTLMTANDCGIGYVHMGKLTNGDIGQMYSQFQSLPALIFDMRDYPQGTAWTLCTKLASVTHTFAHILKPSLTYPGVLSQTMASVTNPDMIAPYQGSVIVLVSEATQSQAEYSTMMLQGLGPKVKVLGSQTAGADGDITIITLSGGINSYFSTLQIRYPDNYNTQRVGVRIDHTVTPTIAGIRSGIDEQLESALELLSCSTVGVVKGEMVTEGVFPNPARSFVVIPAGNAGRKLILYNSQGQVCREVVDERGGEMKIGVEELLEGLYYLKSGEQVFKIMVAR